MNPSSYFFRLNRLGLATNGPPLVVKGNFELKCKDTLPKLGS